MLSKTPMTTTRPPRQPPPSLDFSLSANERPHRGSTQPYHGESNPPLRTSPPLAALKTQWTPRSAARRRLERLRGQRPPPLRSRCKYRQFRNRVDLIFLPLLNIDHPHENKKLEYKTITDTSSVTDHTSSNKKLGKNKTTTDNLPCFDFFDVLPEYKNYLYWEVRAG